MTPGRPGGPWIDSPGFPGRPRSPGDPGSPGGPGAPGEPPPPCQGVSSSLSCMLSIRPWRLLSTEGIAGGRQGHVEHPHPLEGMCVWVTVTPPH